MNGSYILEFLTELVANNNREWFAENKGKYELALNQFTDIVNTLIAQIGEFDPSIRGLQAKECIFRIYRDVRFSKDKSPYKNHFGAYISANGGRKSERAGYYIHFQPGECLLAGGLYHPTPPVLKAIREAVFNNIEEYKEIVHAPVFDKFMEFGEKLKTVPRGFPKDFPDGEYLKSKDFGYMFSMNEEFYNSEDFIGEVIDIFEEMKPLNNFLNYTVDEVLENE